MSYLKILLKLQFIIFVNSQHSLVPVYKIAVNELTPPLKSLPRLSECIHEFKYLSNNSKDYLGIKIDDQKFMYAELDKKYNPKDKCLLDDPNTFPRKEIVFKSENDFMVLANGCFLIDGGEFYGIIVLMQDEWRMDFLLETFSKFNISKFVTAYFIQDSLKLRHCLTMDCSRYDNIAEKCEILEENLQIDGSNEIIAFSIISTLLLIVFAVFAVLWFIKINK